MQYPYPIARFYFATLCYIANILLFYLMLDFKFDYYQIQLPYHTYKSKATSLKLHAMR